MPNEPPKTLFAKLGAALPIALTAVATAFAGLSSSEMSRAMFWRSVAAQDQAKAASQWSFAGFKRDRSMMAENTAAILRSVTGKLAGKSPPSNTSSAIVDEVRNWMRSPDTAPPPTGDESIRSVMNAILRRDPDQDAVKLAGRIDASRLEAAIATAHAQAITVENAWDDEAKAAKDDPAAGSDVDALRYRAESTMNFWVGYLYEVRVRASTFQSERHRIRSENFFYAMLGAQVGATIASLALARRTGNTLWLLAGIAGVIAVAFGAYVYVTL